MQNRSSKNRDINQLAASIVGEATGELLQKAKEEGKDPLAVLLGQRGGLKGGKARAAKLSAEQRHQIAQKAANARWKKDKNSQ